MNTHSDLGDQAVIDREASAWLVRIEDSQLSPADEAAFSSWCATDPRHADTYDAMARTWSEISQLDALADLVSTFSPVAAPDPRARRWPSLVASGVVALAAILLVALFLPQSLFQRGEQYQTQVAEMRIVTLPDGSSVTLGAKSAITVRYTDAERRIELSGGEAFFDVVHDAARPFLVTAGASVIRDIGTKFDVNLSRGTVRVSVLEGKVAVSRVGASPIKEKLIVAGQRTEVALPNPNLLQSSDAIAPEIVALPAQLAGAWREGRLTYENVRLADLVSDVNRYYAPGVELRSAGIGDLRVTASFKTSEIPAFMSALSATLPVRAEAKSGGRFAVSDAGPSGS